MAAVVGCVVVEAAAVVLEVVLDVAAACVVVKTPLVCPSVAETVLVCPSVSATALGCAELPAPIEVVPPEALVSQAGAFVEEVGAPVFWGSGSGSPSAFWLLLVPGTSRV